MFLQLVTPPVAVTPFPTLPGPADIQVALDSVTSLFQYHPMQISAIVETVWRRRYNPGNSPFVPWPANFTDAILNDTAQFSPGYTWSPTGGAPVPILDNLAIPPNLQPAIASLKPTNWDHLIYAYLVENTRIFDIFSEIHHAFMVSERLETPSVDTQRYLRNLEFLIYGDAMPSMVWTTASRSRPDETANRMCAYYWMFGVDLSHAPELAKSHPYEKPEAANKLFFPVAEELFIKVWRGIVNAKNSSGINDTDDEGIATLCRRLYDMMTTRRLNGNFSREEFRAVSVMSLLELSIMYNSPLVVDLRATGSSPEQRLMKMADRVGMKAHSQTKPFLDLAQPFSFLLQAIETGYFNTAANASLLYTPGQAVSQLAETVIDQYSLATGRDVKSTPVAVSERLTTRRQLPPVGVTQRVNARTLQAL